MASIVLSGTSATSSNPLYTNNTGGNVRVVINYMKSPSNTANITLRWGNTGNPVIETEGLQVIGRNLATSYIDISKAPNQAGSYSGGFTYSSYGTANNNNALPRLATASESYFAGALGTINSSRITGSGALPTELMLSNGEIFGATCGNYNIVIIPENG